MTATPEGNRKIAKKLLAADPLYYKKLGARGGKKSSGGPLKGNSEAARKLVNRRWSKVIDPDWG